VAPCTATNSPFFEPAAHAGQGRGVNHAHALGLHHGRGADGRRGLDHIAPGLAGNQAAGVVVLWGAKHIGHTALLHQHALLHHGHAVGKAAHQVQVVRDQQHGHTAAALQVGEQIENLAAQRDVERRGGLVGQQQRGLAGQGHGDHGALALAAAQLVRKAVGAALGLGNAGFC
jgi:hypothetical protein